MTLLLAVGAPVAAADQQPGLIRAAGPAQDLLIVLGAGIGVLVLLIIWAVYLRRRSRHHSSHHHHHHRSEPAPTAAPATSEEEPTSHHHHHRRRRQKREHRGRNPTLAETGGLPPPRPEGTPPTVM